MHKTWINKYHIFLLFLILIIAFFVRLAYLHYSDDTIDYESDSAGYYLDFNDFSQDFIHNLFSPYRTPGYRLITYAVIRFTGKNFPSYTSQEFYDRAFPIFYVQTAMGLIGLLFLYNLLARLRIPKVYCLVFTAFTAFNIYQFIWERAFLTEAICISLITIMLWLFVELISKPRWTTGFLFVAVSIIGLLIRPGGVALPYILLPLIWVKNRTKKIFTLIVLLMILYTSAPGLYVAMNAFLYKYPGISINTDFSVFGRILRDKIPVRAAAKDEPTLYDRVVAYESVDNDRSMPWYYFVIYNDDIYDHISDLRTFNRLVLTDQFPAFTGSVIRDIPQAMFDTDVGAILTRDNPEKGLTNTFFTILTKGIAVLQQSTVIFLFLFPPSVVIALRKPTKLNIFLLGIGLMEVYQIFSSLIFGGAWEFSRHMIVTQTYLFFFCFWWVGYIISWIRIRFVPTNRSL